jgi:uncharacterized membrane protein (UPF0136 family)
MYVIAGEAFLIMVGGRRYIWVSCPLSTLLLFVSFALVLSCFCGPLSLSLSLTELYYMCVECCSLEPEYLVMGYLKRGSVISVVAGALFAVLLGMSAFKVSNPDTAQAGYQFSVVVNFVMGAPMCYHFLATGKFIPAGLVSLLSVAVGVHSYVHL